MIALFATISGFGEGLHYIPGCGHATPIGEQYLLLGIGSPGDRLPLDESRELSDPEETDIPIYDEDQCAICSVVGHKVTSGDSFLLILVTPLLQELPPTAITISPAAPSLGFQARAPPLV